MADSPSTTRKQDKQSALAAALKKQGIRLEDYLRLRHGITPDNLLIDYTDYRGKDTPLGTTNLGVTEFDNADIGRPLGGIVHTRGAPPTPFIQVWHPTKNDYAPGAWDAYPDNIKGTTIHEAQHVGEVARGRPVLNYQGDYTKPGHFADYPSEDALYDAELEFLTGEGYKKALVNEIAQKAKNEVDTVAAHKRGLLIGDIAKAPMVKPTRDTTTDPAREAYLKAFDVLSLLNSGDVNTEVEDDGKNWEPNL
jgi:hypothetical protein